MGVQRAGLIVLLRPAFHPGHVAEPDQAGGGRGGASESLLVELEELEPELPEPELPPEPVDDAEYVVPAEVLVPAGRP